MNEYNDNKTVSYFSFPHNERRLILVLLDALWLNAAFILYLEIRPDLELSLELLLRHPLWFLVLNGLWILFAFAFDLYDLRVADHFPTALPALLKAAGLFSIIYPFIPYITPSLPASRWPLFVAVLLPFAGLLIGRSLYILITSRPAFQQQTLIIGAGWAGTEMAEILAEYADGSYHVAGFVDDDPGKKMLPVAEMEYPVLGDRTDLKDLIQQYHINTLVVAITHNVSGELMGVLTDCLEFGVEIVPMPVLYEQLTGRVPVSHVGDNWYLAMPLNHPGTRTINRVLKRLFDIIAAAAGALLLLPFLPLVALALYLDSPGPIFYSQERVGRGGKIFRVYKFRSMIPDAERNGAVWADEHDPRVTRVGRFLRATHIDEFPQFWNILRGEMSAVGPRPERPEFVEELVGEIPFYRVRHAVKPGMAGWGLVRQGYGSSRDDALLKLQYDLYYIKHQSFLMDLGILLKTIFDTVTLGGR